MSIRVESGIKYEIWDVRKSMSNFTRLQIQITVRLWKPSWLPYSPIKSYEINTLFDRKINELHDRHDISKRVIILLSSVFHPYAQLN